MKPSTPLRALCCAACLTALSTLSTTRAQAPPSEEGDPGEPSRFVRLAAALHQAPSTEQSDFIAIALTEMAIAYSAEAELARRQAPAEPGLWQWARSVDAYSAGLVGIAGAIDGTAPVRIDVLPGGQVQMMVRGKVTIIGGPRPQQEAALEFLIVEHFCSRYHCERLLAGFEATPVRQEPTDTEPRWIFSDQGGPTCTTVGGLALRFSDTSRLRQKRAVCQQLTDELEHLVSQLARQQRQGVVVDWARLEVAGSLPGLGLRLQLNRARDSLLIEAPLLAAHPGLLQSLRPWLQARAEQRPFALTLPEAESLVPDPTGATGTVLTLAPD